MSGFTAPGTVLVAFGPSKCGVTTMISSFFVLVKF